MFRCTGCSGHGTCVDQACVCTGNWTGNNCDRCATGTHAAGSDCVADVDCTATSCNGHGRCNDASGSISCVCSRGFDGAACDRCALGYIGYPNCTLNSTDDGQESDTCTAPLLPNDLNGPAFLDYDGHLHIQGFYYVNPVTRLHQITFTITQESLFRIYTEPHDVDIDVRLYLVGTSSNTLIDYGISFGLEETLYRDIQPGNYMIQFNYYFWSPPPSDCETFNMELAIAPLTSVVQQSNSMSYYCGATNNLPNLPSQLVITDEYMFDGSGFTVNAPQGSSLATANYFYRINITINPPPNMIASLHAVLGYRFLQGDLSLLLEGGSSGFHCNNTGTTISLTPPPGCAYGDNLENLNTLHRYIEAGDYVLWIYEPKRQNSSVSTCSPFDFGLHVTFYEDTQDIFNCGAPLIPLSLDNSEFEQQPGYIHFRDFFVLDGRAMNFTVTSQSLMRVVVAGVESSANLYNAATGTPVSTNGDSQNLLASLPTGVYYLKFTTDMFQFCPVLFIEFALAPVNSPVNQVINCSKTPTSPNIVVNRLPFTFAPNISTPIEPHFYSFNTPSNPIVYSVPFTLSNEAFFDAAVESDFLRANLRIELWSTSTNNIVANGYNDYSYNHWQQALERGSYEVRIVLPPGQTVPGIPTCQRYNFNLRLVEISPSTPVCQGEFLPFTFNSMRFLGYEGSMNYQSDGWRVPFFSTTYTQNINFTVPVASMIRAYTEPHSVDVDIALMFANNTGSSLTSGSNGIGGEESFTYMLAPNVNYIFQLRFFNFAGGSVICAPPFSIEIEIAPVPTRPATCPGGGQSYWPTIPSSLTLPYTYNSIDNNITYYFQQVSRRTASKDYSFSVTVAVNLFVEVGYDFLVGDLVVKLVSSGTKQVYYGENSVDRNSLLLINIPAGSYVLTIYEPSVNMDSVVACSDFTFAIYVDAFSSLVDADRSLIEYHLPSNLNSIPFLNASSAVHIANNFFMFDGTGRHESTDFTINEQSIIRVESLLAESEYSSGYREVPQISLFSNSQLLQSGNGSLYYTLQKGSYTVRFYPPPAVTEQGDLGVRLFVQLAIATLSEITSMIGANPNGPTCADVQLENVQISPTGFYQENVQYATVSYATLSTKTDVVRIPFVLDRYSLVYLQIGANFLLDELDVRVFGSNNSLLLHGRIWKNLNEIHTVPPSIPYLLSLRINNFIAATPSGQLLRYRLPAILGAHQPGIGSLWSLLLHFHHP